MKEFTDDDNFKMALNMVGIQTNRVTRDMITELYKLVKKKKKSVTLEDITKVEIDVCKKHQLDPTTKMPYSYPNKKFFIARTVDNGIEFKDEYGNFDKDPEKAHDYKTLEFAEEMIRTHEYKNVLVIPYYG